MTGEARQTLCRLWRELRSNMAVHARNGERLRWALLYYTLDEPAVLLPDWDWSWPPTLDLERPNDRAFRRGRWRHLVRHDLISQVEEVYRLLWAQPPDMAAWDAEYTADVPLIAFVIDKLDECQARLDELAGRVVEELERHV